MKTSEKTNNLDIALFEVYKVTNAMTKDGYNPFHDSNYLKHETLDESLRPVLIDNGLAITRSIVETASGRLLWATRIKHESGQWQETYVPYWEPQEYTTKTGKLQKPTVQDAMASVTYAARYGDQHSVGLVTKGEDDDGNRASGHVNKDGWFAHKTDPTVRYPNKPCIVCGIIMEVGTQCEIRKNEAGKWEQRHPDGQCKEAEAPKAEESDLPFDEPEEPKNRARVADPTPATSEEKMKKFRALVSATDGAESVDDLKAKQKEGVEYLKKYKFTTPEINNYKIYCKALMKAIDEEAKKKG